nr:hypothetical protein OG409_17705 [Streptomyces sp. NBC_00974]
MKMKGEGPALVGPLRTAAMVVTGATVVVTEAIKRWGPGPDAEWTPRIEVTQDWAIAGFGVTLVVLGGHLVWRKLRRIAGNFRPKRVRLGAVVDIEWGGQEASEESGTRDAA